MGWNYSIGVVVGKEIKEVETETLIEVKILWNYKNYKKIKIDLTHWYPHNIIIDSIPCFHVGFRSFFYALMHIPCVCQRAL